MQWQSYIPVTHEPLYTVHARKSQKKRFIDFPPSTTAQYMRPFYACLSSLCPTETKNRGADFVSTSPTAHVTNTRDLLCIELCILECAVMWLEFLPVSYSLLVREYRTFNINSKMNGFWVGECRVRRFIIERRP
jgi:hypothetical protein